MKHGQYIGGSVAGLQLGHQRMRENVFLRLLLILFNGCTKDSLEIGRSVCLRHGKSKEERRLKVGSWP